jgi:chromosome segregation ATPase
MSTDLKSLSNDIERLKSRIDNLDENGDVYQSKNEIDTYEKNYNRLCERLNDITEGESNLEKPLISKVNQMKSDLEIILNLLNRKKEGINKKYNFELLKNGELTGADKIKTERDMIMDQHKQIDYQGDMIDSIGSNIKSANNNLVNINTELKNQGEQMNRIQDHVANAESEVKQTEKIMTRMERRQKCMKIVGGCSVVILGIFDVFWLVFWLIKFFGNK